MDLSNLKQSHTKLISHMKVHGYSENYIHTVQIEINWILLYEKDNPWNSYQDIYHDYELFSHSKRSLLRKATLIGIIANFDLKGIYPGRHQWHALWDRGVYTQLLPEFKALVDYYRNTACKPVTCEGTVKSNLSTTSNFLYALQEMGCFSLTDVSETHVLAVFSDDGKGPGKSAGHKNNIARILLLFTANIPRSQNCISMQFCEAASAKM